MTGKLNHDCSPLVLDSDKSVLLSPLLFAVYMNWTDTHSRVDEGVGVGSCRINRLLFADNLVLLASSQQSLQHALDRFSAACHRAGMKISTKNTELCRSTNPRQCMLQVSGTTLQQVEKFMDLGVVAYLTEGGARRLIHGLVKLTQFCLSFIALWSQNGSFQAPQSCLILSFKIGLYSDPYLWS